MTAGQYSIPKIYGYTITMETQLLAIINWQLNQVKKPLRKHGGP